MKQIAITVVLECRDDVPDHVVRWMGENLLEHALHEFDDDYDPDFVRPSYEGPPLAGDGEVQVAIVIPLDDDPGLPPFQLAGVFGAPPDPGQ